MGITAASVIARYIGGKSDSGNQENFMAYVITDNCVKDNLCVDVCPTDCIHPKTDEAKFEESTQLYVDPNGCIDCGACVPACGSDAIFVADEVPEEKKHFIEKNAAYYAG